MSDPAETPTARHQPAPEVIEIAKSIARGLARQDYEDICEKRRREVEVRKVTYAGADVLNSAHDEDDHQT